MAKLVICGIADCPFYTIAENIGDYLKANFDDFHITKVQKLQSQWDEWLTQICSDNKWSHKHSPLIYRELINTGGKIILIGGINDFQEYAHEYYNVKCTLCTERIKLIAQENLEWKLETDRKYKIEKETINPTVITIVDVGSQGGLFLAQELLSSKICKGKDVQLNAYDKQDEILKKIEDLENVGFDSLRKVLTSTKLDDVLVGSDIVFFVGGFSKELCELYSMLCKKCCKMTTKYVFCGIDGDVHLFAQIFYSSSNGYFYWSNVITINGNADIKIRNKIAKKIQVPVANVSDLLYWGNFYNYFYISYKYCKVLNSDGAIQKSTNDFRRPLKDVLYDQNWIETSLVDDSDISNLVCNKSGALAHVNKILNILEQWLCSGDGNIYSIGIISQGWFEVPENIVFNFPVVFSQNGGWSVVEDIELSNDDIKNIFECVKNQQYLYENYVSVKDKTRIDKHLMQFKKSEESQEN